MLKSGVFTRRRFFQHSAVLAASAPLLAGAAENPCPVSLQGRIYKTLKVGMIRVKGSLEDKFRAAKTAGFTGIEMDCPGLDVKKTRAASAATGMQVDGTVISSHWSIRHSDPDPVKRATALEHLKSSLRETRAVGGHTTLLVVGHGKDGSHDEVWQRSIANISQAVPLAAELGVVIAIENVWNHFLYDHGGDASQSVDPFIRYLDEINSPWVGMQFDIGNHWKYGATGNWIRRLGRRIVKLDAKGFSRNDDTFTKIGEGDLDWLDVRKALLEINFFGWCAAEVGGGGPDRLREISTNMDRVFCLQA